MSKLICLLFIFLEIAPIRAFNREWIAFAIFGALIALKNEKKEQESVLKGFFFVLTNASIGYMTPFALKLFKDSAPEYASWLSAFCGAFLGMMLMQTFKNYFKARSGSYIDNAKKTNEE